MVAQWLVRLGHKQHGPFTEDQLQKLMDSGKISGETSVSADGQYWIRAGEALNGPSLPSVPSNSFENLVDEVLTDETSSTFPVTASHLADDSEMPIGWSAAERISDEKRQRLLGNTGELRAYPALRFYASLMRWAGWCALMLALISAFAVLAGAFEKGFLGLASSLVLAFSFFVSAEFVLVFLNMASDVEQQRRITEQMALSMDGNAV